MNDPWDGLRELPEYLRTMGMLLERYEQGGRGRLLYTAREDVAKLLTDADALLAVVPVLKRAERDVRLNLNPLLEKLEIHPFTLMEKDLYVALAALPEHLRDLDRDERWYEEHGRNNQ